MISRGQVLVRAKDPDGRWINADVLDLDEESFRVWIVSVLCRGFHVAMLPQTEPALELRTRGGEEGGAHVTSDKSEGEAQAGRSEDLPDYGELTSSR